MRFKLSCKLEARRLSVGTPGTQHAINMLRAYYINMGSDKNQITIYL